MLVPQKSTKLLEFGRNETRTRDKRKIRKHLQTKMSVIVYVKIYQDKFVFFSNDTGGMWFETNKNIATKKPIRSGGRLFTAREGSRRREKDSKLLREPLPERVGV